MIGMQLSLEELKKILLVSPRSEIELLDNIKRLHQLFTTERQRIQDYADSLELVSAYTAFYLPTNIVKFDFLISKMPHEAMIDLANYDFIDWGTGPGTYLLAFLQQMGGVYHGTIYGVDSSQVMLTQASRILEHYFPQIKNKKFQMPSEFGHESRPSILCLGNSLNELSLEDFSDLLQKVAPEYVFIIEPGTKEMFAKMLCIREIVARDGFSSIYPCSSLELKCPLQKRDDWCHQVILKASHHPSIERISQQVGLDRRNLPLIGHIYCRKKYQRSQRALLLRKRKEAKGVFYWELCDQNHQLLRVEILKRNYSKDRLKQLQQLNVGSLVDFQVIKEMDAGEYRIELTSF